MNELAQERFALYVGVPGLVAFGLLLLDPWIKGSGHNAVTLLVLFLIIYMPSMMLARSLRKRKT